jgi:hypothetical protein
VLTMSSLYLTFGLLIKNTSTFFLLPPSTIALTVFWFPRSRAFPRAAEMPYHLSPSLTLSTSLTSHSLPVFMTLPLTLWLPLSILSPESLRTTANAGVDEYCIKILNHLRHTAGAKPQLVVAGRVIACDCDEPATLDIPNMGPFPQSLCLRTGVRRARWCMPHKLRQVKFNLCRNNHIS